MAKIVLVSSKDNNFYNFRSELVLRLVEMGYDVVLVCPPGEKIKFFTERGCRFVGHNIDRRGTSAFNDLKLIYDYFRIFRREKPDVVLAYTGKSSVYGGLVCGCLNIPCIINNAGLVDPKCYNFVVGAVLEILYRVGFRKAACMMYQNSQERDHLNKVLNNKIYFRNIPGSGVNLDTFSYEPYPINDDVITFNFVARIVGIKGISDFLDCAELIKTKYPNTRFVIYGDYDDEFYRFLLDTSSANGIVEYAGVKLDMKPYIAVAHAVIHPSYYEGMTNVVLEHGAMGRPSIGSDVPGVRDGIDNGKTGYTFPVRDVDALVIAVEKFILLSHAEKEEMGKAARKKMEREFNRNIVTHIYIEEINKILDKR